MADSRVRDLLANLRRAQRRRIRPVNLPTHSEPSLPFTSTNFDSSSSTPAAPKRPAGPKPPPSWSSTSRSCLDCDVRFLHDRSSSAWRAKALGLHFASYALGPAVDPIHPTLQEYCIRQIVASDIPSIVPARYMRDLPSQIRARITRRAAICTPLTSSKTVRSLIGEEGHAHGEVILVGAELPSETGEVPRGLAESESSLLVHSLFSPPSTSTQDASWDDASDSDTASSDPILSLILLNVLLPEIFPASLTHLSLLSIPTPISFPNLVRGLPALIFLDVSYNHINLDALGRVQWRVKWAKLRVLGLRECWAAGENVKSLEVMKAINEVRPGRWIDFVLDESSTAR